MKFLMKKNVRKYEHYEEMLPKPNEPGQVYGTAKTHKFTNIDKMTIDKFHPIIAQTGTYTYNAAQVIAKYLKTLCSGNNYVIRNTQEFLMSLKQQDPLFPETIYYILQEIFVKENYRK